VGYLSVVALFDRHTLPMVWFLHSIFISLAQVETCSRAFSMNTPEFCHGLFFWSVYFNYGYSIYLRGPSVQLLVHSNFKRRINLLDIITSKPAVGITAHADRLLRITNYDQGSKSRAITDLALTAFEFSFHVSFECVQFVKVWEKKRSHRWRIGQNALADAFLLRKG